MENFVLIDSNAIIHRSYHALPKTMSSRGVLTNAVYGYTITLIKVLEELKPKYIAATFDLASPTFRHEAFAEYKATRVKADQELYDQIPLVRELLESLNIKVFEKSGFEADDCIGTVVEKLKNNKQIIIYPVSGDKDIFQLINGNVKVYNLRHGLSEGQIVDHEYIKKVFNLDPEDFIDLKALAGDSSDNIPGIPGIGPKTATDLIIKFDSLTDLYKNIENEFKKVDQNFQFSIFNFQSNSNDQIIKTVGQNLNIRDRIIKLLGQYKDQAFMSQHLATIERNVPMEFRLEELVWGDYDKNKVSEFFEKVGFKSLLKRFGAEEQDAPKTKKAVEQQNKDKQLKLL